MGRKANNPQNLVGKGFDKHPENINKKGRPPKLPDLEPLLAEVLGEEKDNITAMKMVLLALRKRAFAGDVRACELILDRSYGKLVVKKDVSVDFQQFDESDLDKICEKLSNNQKNEKQ